MVYVAAFAFALALALAFAAGAAPAAAAAAFFAWLGSLATPCALRQADTWLGIRVTIGLG